MNIYLLQIKKHMNLQDIKTQLDTLNKAVSEMENAKTEYTFTKEQMEKFVKHITSILVKLINQSIDYEFEIDEDVIEIDISSSYNKTFEINLEIDQCEVKRHIKDIVSSHDDNGIIEKVMNCYPAIVGDQL